MADLSLEKIAHMQRQNEDRRRFRDWPFACPDGGPDLAGISFHNVSFSYSPSGPPVLKNLDCNPMRFDNQSCTVLLGRNGSGKSTILKLCLGILQPTSGSVDGQCSVGHFSQHFNEVLDQHPDDSAARYLVRVCRAGLEKKSWCTDGERLWEHAIEVLTWFGLSKKEAAERSIRDLSGGQKARVNFAFLSLRSASLLFLDEPAKHLDATGMEHLVDALLHFRGGIVLVSHDELLIHRLLARSGHSRLLVCKDGLVTKQRASGLQGFSEYRRAAFREQHDRAEAAAAAAEKRLRASRDQVAGRLRPRGQKRVASAALSRGGSPVVQRGEQGSEAVPSKPSLQELLRKPKKRPLNMNLNGRAY